MAPTPLAQQLTLFTTCKPFVGEAAILQRNAIRSWAALDLPILICGDEPGTSEIAAECSAYHVTRVDRNERDIPLVSSIFAEAERNCSTSFLAYINADILLRPSVTRAIKATVSAIRSEAAMLLTFRRKNIPLSRELKNGATEMLTTLNDLDAAYACWDQSNALDIFVYNRGLFDIIPPMVIGYMQWDNWLLWKARQRGAQIIDGSLDASLLHPIHGYNSDNTGLQIRTQGADAVRNRALADGNSLDLETASTHLLKDSKIISRTPEMQALVSAQCGPDLDREFIAGLAYLHKNEAELTPMELLDCCRTILWRKARFFPFFESSEKCEQELSEAFSTASILLTQNKSEEAADIIQDLVTENLIHRATVATADARPVMIWGAGQAGLRLLGLLRRHHIPVAGFVDSNLRISGTDICSVSVYSPEQMLALKERQPFIIIGSMHAREIANNLQSIGFSHENDFSG